MVNEVLTKAWRPGRRERAAASRRRGAPPAAFLSLLLLVLSLASLEAGLATRTLAQAATPVPVVDIVPGDGGMTVRFDWKSKIEYSLVRAENLVIVRFSQPVTSDVADLAARGAEYFSEVRTGGNKRLVIFRLKGATPVAHSQEGNVVEIVFGSPKAAKPAAPQLVTLTVTTGDGFQRLSFEWPEPVTHRFAPEARRATLLFNRAGRLRTAAARAQLEKLGIRLSGREVADRLMVNLEFPDDVRLRASADGKVVNVDVFPAAAPAPPAGKGPALSARLDVATEGEATDVTVDWPASVSAAVFRYGGFTWLVFGAPARFDLSNVKRKLGPGIEDIEQILLDNATILRLRTAATIVPEVGRQGWQWHIRLARGGPAAARTNVYVRSDPSAPNGGRVVLLTGAAGSVISVTDPVVGSLLIIVPVNAPGLGVRTAREYVKFKLLPTVQGIVVVPKADNLSVSHQGDEVEVTNPRGLALAGSK